jgi:hypothetical protein
VAFHFEKSWITWIFFAPSKLLGDYDAIAVADDNFFCADGKDFWRLRIMIKGVKQQERFLITASIWRDEGRLT